MFELTFTSTKTVPGTYHSGNVFKWFAPWRAALAFRQDLWFYKVLKDGTGVRVTDNEYSYYMNLVTLAGGGLARYGYTGYEKKILPLDHFSGLVDYNQPFPVERTLTNRCLVDRERDLLLYPGNTSLAAYRASDDTLLWTFNFGDSQTNRTCHWVKDGVVLVEARVSGILEFIDYLRQVRLVRGKVAPYHRAAFDPHNEVIVTLGADNLIRVYYAQAVPDHFEGPDLSPATVSQYGQNDLTVTLLGDADEPCEGWWVHWSLLNSKGTLEKDKSKTDAAGVATNRYFGPDSELLLGEERVMVEVEV